MHNLYIMWLYALRFVTCKVSVDAFSFLYFYTNLNLFVFGATFGELIGDLLLVYVYMLFIRD